MPGCDTQRECVFFQRHRDVPLEQRKGSVGTFCQAESSPPCQRKVFQRRHGRPPCDDMGPMGFA